MENAFRAHVREMRSEKERQMKLRFYAKKIMVGAACIIVPIIGALIVPEAITAEIISVPVALLYWHG